MSVMITLSPDHNQWGDVFTSPEWTAFQVGYCIFCGSTALLALKYLYRMAITRKFIRNHRQFANSIRSPSPIARFCLVFYANGVFSWIVARIMITISAPWNLLTTILISFLWAEFAGGVLVYFGSVLKRMKTVLFVSISLMMIADLSASVATGLWLDIQTVTVIMTLGYAFTTLCIAVIFIVMGRRVLHNLKIPLQIHSKNHSKRLQKMSRHIMYSAIGMFIFIVGTTLASVPALYWNPRLYLIITYIFAVGIQITSITQVRAFGESIQVPSKKVFAITLSTSEHAHSRTGSDARSSIPNKLTNSHPTQLSH